jgi:hypothetical protein
MVIPYRFFCIAMPHALRQLGLMIRWTFQSNEHYNHTYELTELNSSYLDSFIAVVSGRDVEIIRKFSRELVDDQSFRNSLRHCALASPHRFNSDVEPRYGRRIGWYSLIRATRPKIVIETGVDRGLGTAVIAAALKRNAEEGFPGVVYATDIVANCGHLIPEEFKSYCQILIGDSVSALQKFSDPVDIFIHDSDHSPDYEWAEFMAIKPRLHPDSIVLSDNSQHTSKLLEFAGVIKRSFLFFQDVPQDHWWQGDGIGAAFVPGRTIEYCKHPVIYQNKQASSNF